MRASPTMPLPAGVKRRPPIVTIPEMGQHDRPDHILRKMPAALLLYARSGYRHRARERTPFERTHVIYELIDWLAKQRVAYRPR